MLIEQLFDEISKSLAPYKLDDCDKMLLVRGYAKGALNQLKNPDQNEQEMNHIREVFLEKP